MAISKVVFGNDTLIDISDDNVVASALLSGYTAHGADGESISGSIATHSSGDLSASGSMVTVPSGYYAATITKAVESGSATTPTTTITTIPGITIGADGLITATNNQTQDLTPTIVAGYISTGTSGTITVNGSNTSQLSTQAAAIISPTESEQVAVASGKYTTGIVSVGAINSNYIGSNVTQNDATDLSASGSVVTVPSGYYATSATTAVDAGSIIIDSSTITKLPIISVDSNTGIITASQSEGSTSIGATVTPGYIAQGDVVTGNIMVSGSASQQLPTVLAATVTPTESSQIAVSSGYFTTGDITVAAISSDYIGSNINMLAATSYTPSTSTQTILANQYLTGDQTIIGDVNLVAENIASGVTIFGIEGTHTGGTDTSDATLSSGDQMLSGYTAYASDVKYTGTIVTSLDSGNITLNASTTTKSYAAGYYPHAHGAKVTVYDGSVS